MSFESSCASGLLCIFVSELPGSLPITDTSEGLSERRMTGLGPHASGLVFDSGRDPLTPHYRGGLWISRFEMDCDTPLDS
jgi:hypothetical protein